MSYRVLPIFLFFVLNFFCVEPLRACQCPTTLLSMEECDKYEIIFRGKVISVKPCADKFGVVVFEIEELYKGNASKKFIVLFDCNDKCATEFLAGDEWIIYSRYKQVSNAMMDWCSRSRKLFHNANEDFYTVNNGNDYDDELAFLRKKLGAHRLLNDPAENLGERNKLPTTNQTIVLFIASLLAIILFYWLFNKYFRF